VTTSGDPTASISDGGASLPAGVSFVDNGDGTATLSGTPADGNAGAYAVTITAANGTPPAATQNFTLTIGQTTRSTAAPPTPPPTTTTTPPSPTTPTATPVGVEQSTPAAQINGQSAVLGGTVAAHPSAVSYRFGYGSSTQYGKQTPSTTLAGSSTAQPVTATIADLVPGRVYHYRLEVTTNTGTVSYGTDMTLTTPRVQPRRVRDHIDPYSDQHAPYHYNVKGRMILPSGLAHRVACQTDGTATIAATLGRDVLARHIVQVSPTCTYSSAFTFTTSQLTGSGRISFDIRFTGNDQLLARQARTLNALYGRNPK
jgi:hypothetical protein